MESSPIAGRTSSLSTNGDDALELVESLAGRLSNPLQARSVVQGVERFRRLPAEERERMLPGTYLFLEHYLLQLDPASGLDRETLHTEVRQRFPRLLESPAFALVFASDERQEVLLCREFLRPVVGRALGLLGSTAHPSLAALIRWLDRSMIEQGDDEVLDRDGWGVLLGRLGNDLFEQLKESLGDEVARRLYEERYEEVAEQYLGLTTFPAVIRLFPPGLLDESKIRLLSRSQTQRVLLEKLEELQAANRQLEENNADLQMALEVLERGNEELERRVEERTRELGESEERFRLIASSAQDAILMVDPRGRLSYLNRAAERMFDYLADDLLGRPLVDELVPARFRDRYRRAFRDAVRTGRGAVVGQTAAEFVAQRRGGEEFPIELSMSSVKIDGRWNLVGMVRDISQRKREEAQRRQLEEQIQETQRLESLGVLSGGLAHDFNNLLTTILGNVGLMESMLGDDFQMADSLRDIHDAAQRAADLTQQMLAYSGRGRFLVENLDLERLVRDMGELLRASVSKRAVLEYDFAPDLPAVEADSAQLQQVVVNLVTNASDALGEQDGKIAVGLSLLDADRELLSACQLGRGLPAGTYVCLRVSDEGTGMDEATRSRVFEPFFSTKFTGRGLGLAAVLGIVRGHQGAIRVDSEPGRGTTFQVLFPPAEGSEPVAEEPAPAAAGEVGGTVLVVDDEPAVRYLARSVLEAFGFRVLDAEDGLEAVELYRRRGEEIDAVLLDLTMPNMDGEQALTAIRALDPRVPVLLCSGYGRRETMERVAGRRVAGFVHKPYEVEDLVAEVRRAVADGRKSPREEDEREGGPAGGGH